MLDRFCLHNFVGAKVNEIGEVLSKTSIKHKILNLIIFTLLKLDKERMMFMKETNYEAIKICPVCGNHLEEIDDMNYITSICPHCYSAVFEELNDTLHVIKNGIAKDKYNVSMDIFYKQFLSHQMEMRGMLGNTNFGDIIASRMFKVNIYNEDIFNHFYPMVKTFKAKSSYIYFDGYEKYLEMAKDYFKEVYPTFY